MASNFLPPISIEKFAAYLDGNLPENEMEIIDNIASSNQEFGNIIDMSDSIDQDIVDYKNDDFLYNADMSMLDNCNFEIPVIDDNMPQEDTFSQEDGQGTDVDNDEVYNPAEDLGQEENSPQYFDQDSLVNTRIFNEEISIDEINEDGCQEQNSDF